MQSTVPCQVLTVTNTGHGMNKEIKARMFEPFFTTKEKGKGPGIGLAIVYGIVRQSGGCIRVDTSPGRGTNFEIYLPRVEQNVEPAQSENTSPARARATKTVLLAEDEEEVRSLACEFLSSAGYRALKAPDGEITPNYKTAILVSRSSHAHWTVNAADLVTPAYLAMTFTTVRELTALVLTVALAVVAAPGTATLAGTVAAAVLLLDSATTTPAAGAGPLSVTVAVELVPCVTLAGLTAIDTRAGGLTESVAVRVTPAYVA
jgi:CheY-like chemotaxis protein